MKDLIGRFLFIWLASIGAIYGQVLGKTVTEDYVADFESRESIWSIPEYNGDPVTVAILSIGMSQEVLDQYPELGDYRVGLGLTNITTAFLDEIKSIVGIEDKTEEVAEQPVQPQEIIINMPEQQKDTIVKKVIVEPKKEKTATEKRKDEGFDW